MLDIWYKKIPGIHFFDSVRSLAYDLLNVTLTGREMLPSVALPNKHNPER